MRYSEVRRGRDRSRPDTLTQFRTRSARVALAYGSTTSRNRADRVVHGPAQHPLFPAIGAVYLSYERSH